MVTTATPQKCPRLVRIYEPPDGLPLEMGAPLVISVREQRMKLGMLAGAAALGLAAAGGQANASVVIDIYQSDGNVVTTGGGTVDLTDLSFMFSEAASRAMDPSIGGILVGSGDTVDVYSGVTGPASFGAGGPADASMCSGDLFGVDGSGFSIAVIFVPAAYVSGSAFSGSATYVGQTFVSLGLTPGTYAYTWGSGADADSLTVKIGAIPEPATWAMMMLGFGGLGFAGYRAARTRAALPA
jgi:hypothetical protein